MVDLAIVSAYCTLELERRTFLVILRLGKIVWAEMSRNDGAGGLLYYIPLHQ